MPEEPHDLKYYEIPRVRNVSFPPFSPLYNEQITLGRFPLNGVYFASKCGKSPTNSIRQMNHSRRQHYREWMLGGGVLELGNPDVDDPQRWRSCLSGSALVQFSNAALQFGVSSPGVYFNLLGAHYLCSV